MDACSYTESAEMALLGCLILAPELYPKTAEAIDVQDLYFEWAKAVYEAIGQMFTEGSQIDLITLSGRMGSRYAQYLRACVAEVPTIQGIRGYIETVKTESVRRRAQEAGYAFVSAVRSQESLAHLQQLAADVMRSVEISGESRELSMTEGIEQFYAQRQTPRQYIGTGFSQLDSKTFIDRGDYIVIGGRPSSGKTAFALNLAMHMAKTYRVVFFSLETRSDKLFDRLMTSYAMLDFGAVKRHELSSDDWQTVGQMLPEMHKLQFTIVDAAGQNIDWITSKALKLKADIIMLDYLGLIAAEGKTRYEKVTNISVGLHVMAQAHAITVIALSQLSRNGAGVPAMEDLRESGQIEQDADLILLLHHDKENGKHDVIVAKNKEGNTGVVEFLFWGEKQRFVEVDRRQA